MTKPLAATPPIDLYLLVLPGSLGTSRIDELTISAWTRIHHRNIDACLRTRESGNGWDRQVRGVRKSRDQDQ